MLIGFLSFLALLSSAFAQGDEVIYDQARQVLTYSIDYDRLSLNADARECSASAYESGLLHGVLRHLFLFLPFEASYYEAVEELEVLVNQGDKIVLYAAASLENIRTTNKRFRVFMNSFASPRAGFCFAISSTSLELWINTLNARAGVMVYDPAYFSMAIPGALTLEAYAAKNPLPVVVADTLGEAVVASPEQALPSTTEAETTPSVQAAQALPVSPASTNNAYMLTPFLSDRPVRGFAKPELVLEPATDYAALIETSKGQLFIDLFEDIAPETVNNFVFLARHRFYEGMPFYRVIEDFIAQTGDPSGSGLGSPGYQIPDEIVAGISHSSSGIVSMANAGPNTAGSQFFITFEPAPWLDGSYSIFAAVLEGLEVLRALQVTDPGQPLAVATPDTTIGLLKAQGISLNGATSFTIDSYLLEQLGRLPVVNQRVSIDAYDLMVILDPQTEARLVAFWPQSDRVNAITIVQRAK